MIDVAQEAIIHTELPLSAIRTDGGTQPRINQDWKIIGEYAQDMLEGAIFPPVIVFYDGVDYWLADGFHRYHATGQAGKETIAAEVKQGTRRDAILYSVGVNAHHGFRRANVDKRAVVDKLLRDEEWSKWSNREIARQCGVSLNLVNTMRDELKLTELKVQSDIRIGGDGRVYNIANIGHSQPQDPASLADIFDPVGQSVPSAYLPPGFGRFINGEPVTIPLPDGEPVEIPEDWKLPVSMRGEDRRNIDNIPLAVPHISSKNNEWYTPAKYVEAARLLMGAIELDPASCAEANETIQAGTYYDIHTNGLDKDWTGSVWLNPPYGYTNGRSNQDVWSGRLIDQFKNKVTTEAVLLVNAAVDTTWFHRLLFEFPVCLTLGRINFTTPEPTISGSTHGSAFVYFGPQPDRFFEIFSEFGMVVRRW